MNFESRTATSAGKYLILQVFPNGNPNSNHLYYANLEKHGEINGKIPLKPVYTADLNTEFNVSKEMMSFFKELRKPQPNSNKYTIFSLCQSSVQKQFTIQLEMLRTFVSLPSI